MVRIVVYVVILGSRFFSRRPSLDLLRIISRRSNASLVSVLPIEYIVGLTVLSLIIRSGKFVSWG